MVVGDGDDTCIDIDIAHIEILIYFFKFVHFGLGDTVGIDEPVIHIRTVEMIDNIPIFAAVFVFRSQALIDPIPSESALKAGKVVIQIPVFSEITQSVTHTVCVFANDDRTCRIGIEQIFEPFERRIHIGDDVVTRNVRAVPAISRFVMHRPFLRIGLFHGLVCRIEIDTPSRLVTHRPDNDRRMVFVAFHHVHRPFYNSLFPFGQFAHVITLSP